MFYSQFVLTKKGALGRVWLAAHWDRKLNKGQINSTNIEESVDSIINMNVPMALRMTGHLLLGVSRIYARKVKYLLNDCNDALVKIKMAFRTEAQANLHLEDTVANYNAITLPENYEQMEINLPEITIEEFAVTDERTLLNVNLATRRQLNINLQGIDREDAGEDMGIDPDDFDNDILKDRPLLEEPEGFRGEAMEFGQGFDFVGDDVVIPPSPGIQGTPQAGELPPDDLGLGIPDTPTGAPQTPLRTPDGNILYPASPGFSQKPPKEPKKGIAVDRTNTILPTQIKRQLEDTSDLIREIVPTPPNKKAMLQRDRELRGPEAIYEMPAVSGLAPALQKLFANVMNRDLGLPIKITSDNTITPERPVGETEAVSSQGFDDGYGGDVFAGADDQPYHSPEHASGDVSQSQDAGYDQEAPESSTSPDPTTWSERTIKMHSFLDKLFVNSSEISYMGMVKEKDRKLVVGTFFEVLVLKTKDIIEVDQSKAYGDIKITKTENFNRARAVA